jgi:hypothetical protein
MMRMLMLAAVAALALPSAGFAETVVTHVHTHVVTHDDGRRHPQVNRVVRRSTVVTPRGTAMRTTTVTSRTTPH